MLVLMSDILIHDILTIVIVTMHFLIYSYNSVAICSDNFVNNTYTYKHKGVFITSYVSQTVEGRKKADTTDGNV